MLVSGRVNCNADVHFTENGGAARLFVGGVNVTDVDSSGLVRLEVTLQPNSSSAVSTVSNSLFLRPFF